jgi:alkylation response protein AidB-like acyl-CoA dehydrogenase
MEATTRHTGVFLMRTPDTLFTPEQFDAESRQMADATERFVREQVAPYVKRLEHGEPAQMREILIDSAMLGLLGIDIPPEFGGLGLPKTTSALITEKTALQPSFAVSHAVHTSVGSMPLLLFGTEAQQHHYLPKLTAGEFVGAYALTEPDAGSDALSGRTRAERTGDHYRITGNKIWITNAGFADLFVTFAKVNGEHFTAFLVERAPGLLVEREEHKLGLHGSSTCRVVFDGVAVPASNRLGAEGEGAYVALYTLNLGRFKIGAAALGIAKEAWRLGRDYARERRQFGRPIIEYPLVWRKLAFGATLMYAVESAVYRLADDLEQAFRAESADRQQVWRDAAAEYAAECALIKVAATEMLQQVVDDALQIHGGLRLQRGVSHRRAVSRHARKPHLRGHERNQPPELGRTAGIRAAQGDVDADCGRRASNRHGGGNPADAARAMQRRAARVGAVLRAAAAFCRAARRRADCAVPARFRPRTRPADAAARASCDGRAVSRTGAPPTCRLVCRPLAACGACADSGRSAAARAVV